MRLREFQKKSGLTIKESSRMLGLPMSTYNGYLVGNRQPDIETLCKLADFFHCSLDELVGRETDIINLNVLEPEVGTLIKKIIKMNKVQKDATINFVTGITYLDN